MYQRVLSETILKLREKGIDYKGKEIGVPDDYCAFDCEGLTVGIKIKQKSDLYKLWNEKQNIIEAVVYDSGRKFYIVENSFERLINSIKGCVSDCECDFEKTFREAYNKLMEFAELISNKGKYNDSIEI